MLPLFLLIAYPESEAAQRRTRGGKEEAKRRIREECSNHHRFCLRPSQVFGKTVAGFRGDHHIVEKAGLENYTFACLYRINFSSRAAIA
jgi:hypothetical protein